MTKFVEMLNTAEGGPAATPDGREFYVGVYTIENGSIEEECAFFRTPEEQRARYDELLTRPGYAVEP